MKTKQVLLEYRPLRGTSHIQFTIQTCETDTRGHKVLNWLLRLISEEGWHTTAYVVIAEPGVTKLEGLAMPARLRMKPDTREISLYEGKGNYFERQVDNLADFNYEHANKRACNCGCGQTFLD